MGNRTKRPKRGHPVGLLIAFEPMQVVIRKVFTGRTLVYRTINLGRKFKNADRSHLYPFFENLIKILRPLLQEGWKSIILLAPRKNNSSTLFLDHVKRHHQWLLSEKHPHSAKFRQVEETVDDPEKLAIFLQSEPFQEAMGSAIDSEADQILAVLEHRINDTEEGLVLYNLKEIEDLLFSGGKRKKKFKPLKLTPEYILLTTDYLEKHPNKNRVHRMIQIAKNRRIITKIYDSESEGGIRVDGLGGMVCFTRMNSEFEKKFGNKIIDSNV